MLLILAVSESEPAELPRFSSAYGAGPQPPELTAPAWQCVSSQGLGTARGQVASSKEGQAHKQHSPAEPPKTKPQA